MLRCVIFDMDGTIADTLPLCIAAFREAVQPFFDKPVSEQDILRTFGPSEEGTIRALIPAHYEEGVQAYLDHYRHLHDMCPKPFDGIPELFGLLKEKGVRLALVTGKGPLSLPISLDCFGLNDVFDAVETGSPQGPIKPLGLRNILDELKLRPDECIYIGDMPSDVLACREVSVPVVAATWAGTVKHEELERVQPNYLCHSVPELRDLLLTMI